MFFTHFIWNIFPAKRNSYIKDFVFINALLAFPWILILFCCVTVYYYYAFFMSLIVVRDEISNIPPNTIKIYVNWLEEMEFGNKRLLDKMNDEQMKDGFLIVSNY